MGGGGGEANTRNNDPFDHEQRFLLSHIEMRRFLEAIAQRAAVEIYDPTRPISYTRTTYLDTDDLVYFAAAADAPARRLRLREYAAAATRKMPPVFSGVAFLELKQHDGVARSKLRLEAPPAEIASLIGRHAVHHPGLEATASWTAIAAELSRPTMAARMSTWYRRLCLTSDARRVRITVDENLTFCLPQPIGEPGALAAPSGREVVAALSARVLEVKYCGEVPIWLQPALEPLEPADRFSKFHMGMTAMGHGPQGGDQRPTEPAPAGHPFSLSAFVAA